MRIILADHHRHARLALATLLQEQPEFNLIGVVEDTQGLLEIAEEYPADLFLIDRKLPGTPIEDLIERLHTLAPRPTVIIMSSEFEYSSMLLKAGADAFVSKGDQPDWLLETLLKFEQRGSNLGT